MKQPIENILKAIQTLPVTSQQYIIKQLKELANKVTYLELKIEEKRLIIAGKEKNTYTDSLEKSIAILKLLGFSEFTFYGFNADFLNWMFDNTFNLPQYNPKLMNYYLLLALQQSYMICKTTNDGAEPTYKQVKENLLTWDDQIKEYEETIKLSIPNLIDKINGKV